MYLTPDRQTLTAGQRTSRGFTIFVNHYRERVEVSFDSAAVDANAHGDWLSSVETRVGLGEINPQPYWGFQDLYHKAGIKLKKTVYAIADRRRKNGVEHFRYTKFLLLQNFKLHCFIEAINDGDVLVDFDARTGHNHGTKYRLKQSSYQRLYDSVVSI